MSAFCPDGCPDGATDACVVGYPCALHPAESDAGGYVAALWVRDDGTGYYFTCPRCHFYKNGEPGPCRRIGCGGTVERVEVRVTPPGRTDA